MSLRRGYWYLTGAGTFDGPFKSVTEAKEASSGVNDKVSLHAMVVLEKRDERGDWVTVH